MVTSPVDATVSAGVAVVVVNVTGPVPPDVSSWVVNAADVTVVVVAVVGGVWVMVPDVTVRVKVHVPGVSPYGSLIVPDTV